MTDLRRRRAFAVLCAVAFVGGVARSSAASVVVVTDLGDSGAPGQLRTLINAAAPGDTIIVPPGTIMLSGAPGDNANVSGDLDVHKALTVVGAGASLTNILIPHTDRVLDVHADGDLVLSGVTRPDDPRIAALARPADRPQRTQLWHCATAR